MGDTGKKDEYVLFDPSAGYGAATGKSAGDNNMGRIVGSIGIVGGLSMVAYMAKNFKKKNPNMRMSLYVIHTRMFAQGTVIGVMSLGMLHNLYKDWSSAKAAPAEQSEVTAK